MKSVFLVVLFSLTMMHMTAQDRMTPELLWKLGRVSAAGFTHDKMEVVYTVSTPDVEANKLTKHSFRVSLANGAARKVSDTDKLVQNDRLSPDGK